MKRSYFWIFIVVSIVIVASKLDETDNETSDAPSSSPAEPPYALRAADNTWPELSEAATAVVDDLGTKNYYLVFDGSGSMSDAKCSGAEPKIQVAKRSVVEFINKIPGDANIGLMTFDDRGVYERASLGVSSKDQAVREINQVSSGGGTPLHSAIQHAYKALSKQAVKQLGYGEYHLIVVTDGEASSGEDPRLVVGDVIADSPVVLHTIGFCIGGGHSLNQAGLTLYKAANNPQELALGLDSVLAEASDFNVDAFEGQAQ
jgi:hypothetical protein